MAAKLYMVYDSEKKGERIGSFTKEQANQLFGIKSDQVSVYASTGNKFKSRYTFAPESREPIRNAMSNSICLDWDFTTAALRAMAGGGKHGS